jgi:hypothetical protein
MGEKGRKTQLTNLLAYFHEVFWMLYVVLCVLQMPNLLIMAVQVL